MSLQLNNKIFSYRCYALSKNKCQKKLWVISFHGQIEIINQIDLPFWLIPFMKPVRSGPNYQGSFHYKAWSTFNLFEVLSTYLKYFQLIWSTFNLWETGLDLLDLEKGIWKTRKINLKYSTIHCILGCCQKKISSCFTIFSPFLTMNIFHVSAYFCQLIWNMSWKIPRIHKTSILRMSQLNI